MTAAHPRRSWSIALLASALLGIAGAGSSTAMDLRDVIENVRLNERLYDSLEVRHQLSYELVGKPWSERLVVAMDDEGRSVFQAGMSFLDSTRRQTTQQGDSQAMHTLQGFDGEKTRVVEQQQFANLHHGRYDDWRLFRPHLVFMMAAWVLDQRRLSDFIAASTDRDNLLSWSVEEEGDFQGLRCYVLRCEWWPKDWRAEDGPLSVGRFWLAADRNFLPVQVHGYRKWVKPLDESTPVEEFTVDELKELEPGLWFPMRTTRRVYNLQALAERGERIEESVAHVTVDQVDLDPQYDISLFRDIEFPPGIPVYEVKNGEIVGSYIEPQPAGGGLSWWMWLFILANAVLIPLALWHVFRRAKKRRLQPATGA